VFVYISEYLRAPIQDENTILNISVDYSRWR